MLLSIWNLPVFRLCRAVSIKRSNDEEIKWLESSTDLEEIKRRAITELGMVYANENQIIIYHSPDQDYMRKMD